MTIQEFLATPSGKLSGLLLAMWWDAHGEWDQAHDAAQDIDTPDGAWVHAYLHRKEGDLGNAAYWYARANRPVASGDLASEWASIVKDLLTRRERITAK